MKNIAGQEMGERARLAHDTILRKPTRGIATGALHVMETEQIDRLAGRPPGSYLAEPEATYLAMQRHVGACLIGQFIPMNPLQFDANGYKGEQGATTGAKAITRDGLTIDSPEAVVQHLETVVFPRLKAATAGFDEEARVAEILDLERDKQRRMGPEILKSGYAFVNFPRLAYSTYGYENYFMAYALYPEVIERDFEIQADLAVLNNRAAARAYAEGDLPPLYRLDHDMADSRGTLVDIRSLDRIWFPHFARSIEPLVRAGITLLWHCDGNLMQMVPRLLDCGLGGFQGFQYEDGMDYESICRMRTRDGADLVIMAGVSVTRTLPKGTPDDVRRELKWLVDYGPKTGLILKASSSIAPGVPAANLDALVDGLRHYREHGRD